MPPPELKLRPTSENTDPNVEIFLRVFPDLGNQPKQLSRGLVHVLIQLLVSEKLPRRSFAGLKARHQLLHAGRQRVEARPELVVREELAGGALAAVQASRDLFDIGR